MFSFGIGLVNKVNRVSICTQSKQCCYIESFIIQERMYLQEKEQLHCAMHVNLQLYHCLFCHSVTIFVDMLPGYIFHDVSATQDFTRKK